MEAKLNEWLTLAARLASITIIPLGIWMVQGLEATKQEISLIQQKMDLRTQARDQQMTILTSIINDHESRLRKLELDGKH